MVVGVCGGAAFGQPGQKMVAGTGLETLEVLPGEMRMTVGLKVEGEGLEEALRAFEERGAEVAELLKEAGAVADSVEIGDPSVGSSGASRQQQMMMRRMMERSGRAEVEEEGRKTVSFEAKATWKLEAGSVVELILEADAIGKRIEGLDLVGKAKMTPEQLEELEEAGLDEEDYYDMMDEGRQEPGKPSFAFAKKVESAEVLELKKKAYAKAVVAAGHVAAAAGRELGELASLSAEVGSGGYNESDYYAAMRWGQMVTAQGWGLKGDEGSAGEAVALGMRAGKVKVKVRVTAGFALK